MERADITWGKVWRSAAAQDVTRFTADVTVWTHKRADISVGHYGTHMAQVEWIGRVQTLLAG